MFYDYAFIVQATFHFLQFHTFTQFQIYYAQNDHRKGFLSSLVLLTQKSEVVVNYFHES